MDVEQRSADLFRDRPVTRRTNAGSNQRKILITPQNANIFADLGKVLSDIIRVTSSSRGLTTAWSIRQIPIPEVRLIGLRVNHHYLVVVVRKHSLFVGQSLRIIDEPLAQGDGLQTQPVFCAYGRATLSVPTGNPGWASPKCRLHGTAYPGFVGRNWFCARVRCGLQHQRQTWDDHNYIPRCAHRYSACRTAPETTTSEEARP